MTIPTSQAGYITTMQQYLASVGLFSYDDVTSTFDAKTRESWQRLCRNNQRDQSPDFFREPNIGAPDWANELIEDFQSPYDGEWDFELDAATYGPDDEIIITVSTSLTGLVGMDIIIFDETENGPNTGTTLEPVEGEIVVPAYDISTLGLEAGTITIRVAITPIGGGLSQYKTKTVTLTE